MCRFTGREFGALLASADAGQSAITAATTSSHLPGTQLDQVDHGPHAGHSAAAFPAHVFGERRGRPAADRGGAVIGVNLAERQSGDVPGFHEFENPAFDAFVGHGSFSTRVLLDVSCCLNVGFPAL